MYVAILSERSDFQLNEYYCPSRIQTFKVLIQEVEVKEIMRTSGCGLPYC